MPTRLWRLRGKRCKRAFTLVEVMIGVVIIALVMTAVFITFRTGMRAYEASITGVEKIQTSRYVTDTITRDLRSIFFQFHLNYNKNHDALRRQCERAQRDALLAGQDRPDCDPGSYMLRIDLSFKGDEKSVSFVRFQPTQGEMATQPWGLARVKYAFNEGKLVRTEQAVFDLSRNSRAAELPDTTVEEVVGENITAFAIHYGYFFDGEWLESDRWQSKAHDHRNPPIEFDRDDPMGDQIQQINMTMPFDNLPSYVDIELTIADSSAAGRALTFRQMIVLPPAQETYVPVPPNIRNSSAFFGRREQTL